MDVRVGTSGYAYKEWAGAFYPQTIAAADMLGHYAAALHTVEINNTFYRMPKRDVVQKWRSQVPETFRFVLKSTGRITHKKRLKDVRDEVGYLVRASEQREGTRGPTLFQLPPYLRKDVERLRSSLQTLPDGWHDDEVIGALRDAHCAMVVSHGGSFEPVTEATASFGSLRLRQPMYSSDELDHWEAYIRAQDWSEGYVFFKHEIEGAGLEMAKAFVHRWNQSVDA